MIPIQKQRLLLVLCGWLLFFVCCNFLFYALLFALSPFTFCLLFLFPPTLMTQSPNLRFFGLNRERKTASATAQSTGRLGSPTAAADPSQGQTNVHGWLMSVPGYRQERVNGGEEKEETYTIVDEDNNGIPIGKSSRRLQNGRPESISSVSSGDSVNLDDLIKNNFTVQVDDETDLPNLADLDLDDSADDFWKMNDVNKERERVCVW
ncbi:hypothetical protein BJV82DRAFT_151605 [Fennellomyces sp. T-0311]|nr:hypothetical protein BJV82DRAFT_151605 [Fennellomyces sp. T-0311]